MTDKLALVGCDMDFADLIWSDLSWELVGLIDKNAEAGRPYLLNLGSDADWQKIRFDIPDIKLCMTLDLPTLKARLVQSYGEECFVTLISPEAHMAKGAKVGHGSSVQRQVCIMTNVIAGKFCKFNMGVNVHHDCRIGNYCTLSPGARLLGNVTLEEMVFIGSGAVVLPHVSIGTNAVIGAGAVVNRNVAAGTTVAGVPAVSL